MARSSSAVLIASVVLLLTAPLGATALGQGASWCDDFESPSALSNWTMIDGVPQLVPTPTHSGGSSLELHTESGDCEAIIKSNHCTAPLGEYSVWVRQDNASPLGGGTGFYFQLQSTTNPDTHFWRCYRFGSDAGSFESLLQLVKTPGDGTGQTLGSIRPVQYVIGDWVRIFVRQTASGVFEFGYELNGNTVTAQCVDPDPITETGAFALTSCSAIEAQRNYFDDACFSELAGQDPAWCDGFEPYTAGEPLSCPWYLSGNTTGITVDGSIASSGSQSVQMFGQIGGCWAAVADRPHAGLPLLVSLSVRNGSEAISGCHPYRGALTLRTGGPDWTQCPCPELFRFQANGDLEVRVPPEAPTLIPGFALETWHQMTCYLWMPNDGMLHMKLWANGVPLGQFTMPEETWMLMPGFVDISSQEGTAWFDDVCVTPLDVAQCPSLPDFCGRSEEDVNNDGDVTILDVVRLVNVAFRNTPEKPDSCNAVTVP